MGGATFGGVPLLGPKVAQKPRGVAIPPGPPKRLCLTGGEGGRSAALSAGEMRGGPKCCAVGRRGKGRAGEGDVIERGKAGD